MSSSFFDKLMSGLSKAYDTAAQKIKAAGQYVKQKQQQIVKKGQEVKQKVVHQAKAIKHQTTSYIKNRVDKAKNTIKNFGIALKAKGKQAYQSLQKKIDKAINTIKDAAKGASKKIKQLVTKKPSSAKKQSITSKTKNTSAIPLKLNQNNSGTKGKAILLGTVQGVLENRLTSIVESQVDLSTNLPAKTGVVVSASIVTTVLMRGLRPTKIIQGGIESGLGVSVERPIRAELNKTKLPTPAKNIVTQATTGATVGILTGAAIGAGLGFFAGGVGAVPGAAAGASIASFAIAGAIEGGTEGAAIGMAAGIVEEGIQKMLKGS